MIVWMDDIFGMTQLGFKGGSDEEQFQLAIRSIVVTLQLGYCFWLVTFWGLQHVHDLFRDSLL